MSEICRKPREFDTDEGFFEGFDENHTLSDIARWIMQNRTDGEELHRILGEMLNDESNSKRSD